MNKAKRNIIAWGVVIVLALIASLAFTSPVFKPSDAVITLPFALPVLGDTINEFVAIILLSVVVIGAVVAAGIPLVFIYRALDNTTVAVASDDDYKAAMSAIENRQQEVVKELAKKQPPDNAPSHDESRWTAISSALTIGFLFALIGAAFSDEFMGGSNQLNTVWLFTGMGLLIGFLTLNYNRVRKSEASESSPVDWGTIFIVLTGIFIVLLGIGVMMWVRSQAA